jgi:DNA-binding transcriptional regulator WhiA
VTPSWQQANEIKTQQASARDAQLANRALYLIGAGSIDVPSRWREIAQCRIDHPGESWEQVGVRVGCSKFAAASCFRRLLVAAGLK